MIENFEYLNSRVHTRESSTLMFSTVAVSASLLLLGILIGLNIQSYDWLAVVGMLIIILGISYRELTIYRIDRYDYRRIEFKFGVDLKDLNKESKLNSCIRGIIVRMFFYTSLGTWWIYRGRQLLDFLLNLESDLRYSSQFSDFLLYLYLFIAVVIFAMPVLWICFEKTHLRWKKCMLRELKEWKLLFILMIIAKNTGITIDETLPDGKKIEYIAKYLFRKEIKEAKDKLKMMLSKMIFA